MRKRVTGTMESIGNWLIAFLNEIKDEFTIIGLGKPFQISMTREAHVFLEAGSLREDLFGEDEYLCCYKGKAWW